MNPVKARLVRMPQKYAWSSCRITMGIETDSLVRTRDGLDDADCSEYIKFPGQTDTESDERIRCATATGRPLGDDQFLKKLERKLSRCLVPKKAGRLRKKRKQGKCPLISKNQNANMFGGK
jgi:hypothetical protein